MQEAVTDLKGEQDVEPPKCHRAVDVEEVDREHAGGLGSQELPPVGVGVPARRRWDPVLVEDPPDRRGTDSVAELEQLALHSAVPPAGVVRRHPHDQRGEHIVDRWAPGQVRIGPPPTHETAMPAQDRVRGDQAMATHNVGVGPLGDRVVITVRGGRFRGDRLNGSIVRASADWLLQGTDEYGRIDARFTLRTTDGAAIYMQFLGLVENTAPVRTLSDNGIPTKYGDLYFFITPRLETGHERYAWVNRTIFV